MQVISDNYEIIEKIETHMKVVDLWVERSGSELWKGIFGISIAVLFIKTKQEYANFYKWEMNCRKENYV